VKEARERAGGGKITDVVLAKRPRAKTRERKRHNKSGMRFTAHIEEGRRRGVRAARKRKGEKGWVISLAKREKVLVGVCGK